MQLFPVLISTKSSLGSDYDEELDHVFSTDDRVVGYIFPSFFYFLRQALFAIRLLGCILGSVLFPSIGALITDTGGILSHPAIIAREYQLPAVVATGNATHLLKDGQVVTVAGDTGIIEISAHHER